MDDAFLIVDFHCDRDVSGLSHSLVSQTEFESNGVGLKLNLHGHVVHWSHLELRTGFLE